MVFLLCRQFLRTEGFLFFEIFNVVLVSMLFRRFCIAFTLHGSALFMMYPSKHAMCLFEKI
jgi:hypothetical protein